MPHGPNTRYCNEVDDPHTDDDARIIHTHRNTGLDVGDDGVMVTTRECDLCGRRQVKTYGGKGSWRTVRAAATPDVAPRVIGR